MDDNTEMWFGKFNGEKLANVPDWWLKWFYNENKDSYLNGEWNKGKTFYKRRLLMEYIEDNFLEELC